MMEPLVRETLENVLALGTARALTGPIARGDDAVVKRHLEALSAWDARIAAIYRELAASPSTSRASRRGGCALRFSESRRC